MIDQSFITGRKECVQVERSIKPVLVQVVAKSVLTSHQTNPKSEACNAKCAINSLKYNI